ncbi:MAG: ParA family protein [Anaerolineae bacterium]|nr:ParA family protein [Anaerolineae bacterium]
MTQIYAVANQKGGVGKTTTTLNLGLSLAAQKRVLLIDLDPQATLTTALGFDPYRLERSSYSLLMFDGMTLARALKPLRANLALIPGSVDLQAASIKLVQEHHPLERLREVLRATRLPFDYVLIDTPPGLNVLTVVGLLAADQVIVPAQCNHMAIQGIRAVQDVTRRIRENMGNPDLRLRGVLPTFYDPNAVYSQTVLEEIRALLPAQVFKSLIPYDVHVADAPHTGKAVVEYAPQSPGALAYHGLAEEILGG